MGYVEFLVRLLIVFIGAANIGHGIRLDRDWQLLLGGAVVAVGLLADFDFSDRGSE